MKRNIYGNIEDIFVDASFVTAASATKEEVSSSSSSSLTTDGYQFSCALYHPSVYFATASNSSINGGHLPSYPRLSSGVNMKDVRRRLMMVLSFRLVFSSCSAARATFV